MRYIYRKKKADLKILGLECEKSPRSYLHSCCIDNSRWEKKGKRNKKEEVKERKKERKGGKSHIMRSITESSTVVLPVPHSKPPLPGPKHMHLYKAAWRMCETRSLVNCSVGFGVCQMSRALG